MQLVNDYYNDLNSLFKNNYTKDKFSKLKDEDKDAMLNEIVSLYRKVNIFPNKHYTECGIINEIKKCIDREVKFDGNVLDLKYNQGQSLCMFIFPNMINVQCGNDKRTLHKKFFDDHLLKRTIEYCLKYKKSVTSSEIRNAMEMIGGGVPRNFKAMNAKALYERYCPPGGIIYDFSCGFGGRMIGALSSKNNYTYYGVEPNTETYHSLNKLGSYIEQVTQRTNSYKIWNIGSEDFKLENEESVDFVFSSPPYFNLEKYTDEETQCYIKYPKIEDWIDGYVKPTIQNTYEMLKKGSTYAVNIADFNIGNKRIEFVDKWIQLAEEIGFTYIEQIHMKLHKRTGVGHSNKEKKEGIFVFNK